MRGFSATAELSKVYVAKVEEIALLSGFSVLSAFETQSSTQIHVTLLYFPLDYFQSSMTMKCMTANLQHRVIVESNIDNSVTGPSLAAAAADGVGAVDDMIVSATDVTVSQVTGRHNCNSRPVTGGCQQYPAIKPLSIFAMCM